MKKFFVFIVLVFIITTVIMLYTTYNEMINANHHISDLKIELLKMQKVIKADSNIIISKAIEINSLNKQRKLISSKYRKAEKKYHSVLSNYIYIKGQMDSILELNVNVKKDTITNSYSFDSYFDLFEIYGHYCNSTMSANLAQIKPLVLSLGIYKTPNDTPFVMIESNSHILQFDKAVVRFYNYNNNGIMDKIRISSGVGATVLGFNVAIYYDNFGIRYINYINRKEIFLEYQTTIGQLWRMVRH